MPVAAQPSDGQEEEREPYAPCRRPVRLKLKSKPSRQSEAIEDDSEDDEEDPEIPPEALTRAPVLFQSPSGKVLFFR